MTEVIINSSSMTAQYGIPYVIAYSASKTSIGSVASALVVELRPIADKEKFIYGVILAVDGGNAIGF